MSNNIDMDMEKGKINIQLTELQKKHLEAVKWLLGDERAEGKTFLMAYVFLTKALENPGRRVDTFDHYPCTHAKHLIHDEIKRMLEPGLLPYFEFGRNFIVFRPRI